MLVDRFLCFCVCLHISSWFFLLFSFKIGAFHRLERMNTQRNASFEKNNSIHKRKKKARMIKLNYIFHTNSNNNCFPPAIRCWCYCARSRPLLRSFWLNSPSFFALFKYYSINRFTLAEKQKSHFNKAKRRQNGKYLSLKFTLHSFYFHRIVFVFIYLFA